MEIVSLVSCEKYIYDEVYKAIEKNIEDIGGLEKYINKGEKVLLKVNLVMAKKAEFAVTTNPIYVKALANILIDYGVEVYIGDSPGGPFSETLLRSQYKLSGFREVEDTTAAKLLYNTNEFIKKNPDGLFLKSLTLIDMLNDVDKVISVSKLKTHGMMTFTGAVKNMFGIVPGTKKAEYHFKMPKYNDFANALIDICIVGNPVLSFMDGIIGMEGDGPSSGTPRKVGVTIASPSPYHLDKIAISLINLSFEDVPITSECIKRGIVTNDLNDIILKGDIDAHKIDDFLIPETKLISFVDGKLPKPISNLINRTVQPKPIITKNKCVKCGVCKNSCPAKVINMDDGYPKIDLSKCIRCYCCQELCPKHAVTVKRSLLLKLIK
ncbi:MAG: DUF362 domain-containing protein [Lachnospirales bacterium]